MSENGPTLTDAGRELPAPGKQLRQEREQLGISLKDAADALHLRPAVLVGLENDDYSEVPVATYRRGYLRTYAKYLGISEAQILDAYKAHHGSMEKEPGIAPVATTKAPSRVGSLLFKLASVLVIVALIIFTVAWWQSRGGSSPPGMDTSSTESTLSDRLLDGAEGLPAEETALDDEGALADEDTAADAVTANGLDAQRLSASDDGPETASALTQGSESSQQTSQEASQQTSQQTAQEAVTDTEGATSGDNEPADSAESLADERLADPDSAAQVSEASRQSTAEPSTASSADDVAAADSDRSDDRSDDADSRGNIADTDEAEGSANPAEDDADTLLSLAFNQQSWTEVYDADNQRLFIGLQSPGTTAEVEGSPPFRLIIGNATGVDLRYRGDVVDLSEYTGANNVARFNLGE